MGRHDSRFQERDYNSEDWDQWRHWGGGGLPWVTPSGGDIQMKLFLSLNLERTLDKRRGKMKMGVVRRRQLKRSSLSRRRWLSVAAPGDTNPSEATDWDQEQTFLMWDAPCSKTRLSQRHALAKYFDDVPYVCNASACVRVDRSFGVLLWEIFTFGYMPYPGRSNLDVIDMVMAGGRLDIPSTCPTTVGDVMLSCWARDADQRPSFAHIVQRLQVHPYTRLPLSCSPIISLCCLLLYRPMIMIDWLIFNRYIHCVPKKWRQNSNHYNYGTPNQN